MLQRLYGLVFVPEAVLMELRHPRAPTEVRNWATMPPNWLELRRISRLDPTLSPELGAGEREAISLALELRADSLLMDEMDGRRQAESRNLFVAGTLAVLVRSALRGFVVLPDELQQLRRLGFRMSTSTERDTLALYERLRM